MRWSLFLLKNTPRQMSFCEYCEIFKNNIYFGKQLQTVASSNLHYYPFLAELSNVELTTTMTRRTIRLGYLDQLLLKFQISRTVGKNTPDCLNQGKVPTLATKLYFSECIIKEYHKFFFIILLNIKAN